MKNWVYAIKDRLLDFHMSPVVAPGEKEIMSSLATLINDPGSNHAIAQAPKDFDLYQLGFITEEGHVVSDYRIICSCAGLVRDSVRDRPASAGRPISQPVELSSGTPDGGSRN